MVDVKEELKRQVKKRVFSTVLKASLPWLLPILGIGFLIIFIIAVLTSLCNPQDFKTWFAQQGLEWTGILPSSACEAFSGFKGVVGGLARVDVAGPPVEGGTCPNVSRPPRVTKVECIDCVDLKTTVVPVKEVNTNSLANRVMTQKLIQLRQINDTFRVTEGFCPTIYHSSPGHYDGLAIDINLKSEFKGDRAKLAQLYRDARSVGFDIVLCEYPAGYLRSVGISCFEKGTTDGGHLHLEIRSPDLLKT